MYILEINGKIAGISDKNLFDISNHLYVEFKEKVKQEIGGIWLDNHILKVGHKTFNFTNRETTILIHLKLLELFEAHNLIVFLSGQPISSKRSITKYFESV